MASTNALNHRVSRHLALPASSSTVTLRSPSSQANESPSSGSMYARRLPSSIGPVPIAHSREASIRNEIDMPSFKRNFKDWSIAQSQPVTATAYALAAISTQVPRAKSDSTSMLVTRFPLSVITLQLMLLEEPLVSKIIAIAKHEFPRSEGCTEIPGNARTHACASCVGSDALWIIASIRLLIRRAHLASAASEDLDLCPVRTCADASELKPPSVPDSNHAIDQPLPEDFHHQSAFKTTSGTLLLRWHIAKRARGYEENIVSFAFASHVQLDASISGLFCAFAKVRSYEPCRLYIRPSQISHILPRPPLSRYSVIVVYSQ